MGLGGVPEGFALGFDAMGVGRLLTLGESGLGPGFGRQRARRSRTDFTVNRRYDDGPRASMSVRGFSRAVTDRDCGGRRRILRIQRYEGRTTANAGRILLGIVAAVLAGGGSRTNGKRRILEGFALKKGPEVPSRGTGP